MKKISSQIIVGLVCAILGFMVTYQFKVIGLQEANLSSQGDSGEITTEVQRLKDEKSSMNKQINELQNKISQFQNAEATKSGANKQMVSELNNLNMITGNTDVKGQGIIITITPKNNTFAPGITDNSNIITDKELIDIVNELRFAGAEAISINDIRVLSDTGIKTSGGISNIFIGTSDKISPYAKIVIKAIGDKDKLNSAMVFPGVMDGISSVIYDVAAPQKSDSVSIGKANVVQNFEYAKNTK
ncbi:MAG: DUF881 domain-containing protein [Clostridium sp.]|nr:DUF881 domain-containing protein [Clostridium sp.]